MGVVLTHRSACGRGLLLALTCGRNRDSEGEEDEERHHEAEQPHSLRQRESQNRVVEELLLQRRVPSVPHHQATEHRADTGTCAEEEVEQYESEHEHRTQ